MKLISAILFTLLSQNSFSNEIQLGAVLGAPTGISAKFGLENNRAIDMALAYSLADDLGLLFHADYLIENAHSFATNSGSPFELYYGIGFRAVSIRKGEHADENAFGPRAPIGLSYRIGKPRVEFFGELALAFDLVPRTNLDLEGGVGVRYIF